MSLVKWAIDGYLMDMPPGPGSKAIPVIPLSALTEVVEGLLGKTTKERCECVDWDSGYLAAVNDILAQLAAIPAQDAGAQEA